MAVSDTRRQGGNYRSFGMSERYLCKWLGEGRVLDPIAHMHDQVHAMPRDREPLSYSLPHTAVERTAHATLHASSTAASATTNEDQVGLAPVPTDRRGVNKACAVDGIADPLERDHEPSERRETGQIEYVGAPTAGQPRAATELRGAQDIRCDAFDEGGGVNLEEDTGGERKGCNGR